jgi:DNA-binding transcriptional regulator LsrR (DeoR family)
MYVTAARVCHMYYKQGLTQQQIAGALGVSRIRVSRMIGQALADGVVRISIAYRGFYPELEEALAQRYEGMAFVVADPLDGSDEQVKQSIAAAAAELLDSALSDGDRLAVGWGSTVRAVAEAMSLQAPGVEFIPLLGGQVHAGLDLHATSVAELMATRTGGTARRIFAPAVAADREERDALVQSALVHDTLAAAASATMSLVSVGAPFSGTSTLEQVGYYSAQDIADLRRSGAACDIVSVVYFDEHGRRCSEDLTARTVSISEEQLRGIAKRVCVAGGPSKHMAIGIAVRSGFFDVLVTDADSATRLLQT